MAAQSLPVSGPAPGKTNRYKVKILTHDDGRQYQTVLRASHPIDAALDAMRRLGLDGVPSTPFMLFVGPVEERLQ